MFESGEEFGERSGVLRSKQMFVAKTSDAHAFLEFSERSHAPVKERSQISHDVRRYDALKRAGDILGALLLITALSPVIAIVALLVKITSRGPVVFKQDRMTRNGKVFTMLKFRTMVLDAERATGAVWASSDDPRITPIGRFLRTYRLDELPQLWNVIRGDMSLIGPRPERPEIVEKLENEFPAFNRRLAVKAGLTGLAQVSGGYASCLRSYRKKLALDLIYVENRCLLLDLRIALKTIMVVLTGSGAR